MSDMTENDEKTNKGAELWRKARREESGERLGQLGEREAMTMAAYLDGTLEADEVEAFEARLASEPELLSMLMEARAAEVDVVAPSSLVRRARALHARQAGGRAAGSGLLWRGLSWAGTAAAFVAVAVIGFELGRMGLTSADQVEALLASSTGLTEIRPGGDGLL